MNKVDHQDEGLFHKIKKYKVVKVFLNAVDRLLHMVESLIVPRRMLLAALFIFWKLLIFLIILYLNPRQCGERQAVS